jgi:ribosome-associated protein
MKKGTIVAKRKKAAAKTSAKPSKSGKTAVKHAAAKKPGKPAAKIPAGIPEKLRDAALKILNDRQGEDIVIINLAGKSSVADYLIIASGRSARQIAAIAHYLREAFEKHDIKSIRVEGLREGNWALVDAGDVVVHLFRPEVRAYYDLEAIWNSGSARAGRA